MGFRIDSGSLAKAERTPAGGLRVPAFLTRTGVFTYYRNGQPVRELRPPEEVFSRESLDSLRDAPVTDDHPWNAPGQKVTPENTRELRRGHVSGHVRADSDKISAALVIDDAELIRAIEGRKRTEVSCGYRCDTDHTPGVFEGQPYDRVQRNIRYNHVAIVKHGRAGSDIKLRLDSEDDVIAERDDSADDHTDAPFNPYGEADPSTRITVTDADGKKTRTTWKAFVDSRKLRESDMDKIAHALDQGTWAMYKGSKITLDSADADDRADAGGESWSWIPGRNANKKLATGENVSGQFKFNGGVGQVTKSGARWIATVFTGPDHLNGKSGSGSTADEAVEAFVAIVMRGGPIRRRDSAQDAPGKPGGKTKRMDSISIDGVDYPLGTPAENEAAAKAHERFAAGVEATEARADAAEERVKTLRAKLAEATDPKRLDSLVEERVRVLTVARATLAADFKCDGLSDVAIMSAVVKAKAPGVKLDGKSDEYIRARFDSISEDVRADSDPDGLGALRGATKNVTKTPETRADGSSEPKDPRTKMREENARRATLPLSVTAER